jgi:hypothetical protein
VSVGNDVVDLDDPEARLEDLHPRWADRVFTAAERHALEASPARHRLHWALWAAKESAYKARKRQAPGTVFSPRELEVDLAPLPASGVGVVVGRVVHRNRRFDLEVRLDRESVHAVARSRGEVPGPLLSGLGRADRDPSLAARRLAATTIGPALDLDPAAVEIVDRPPVAVHRGRRLDAGLSLSHHGRFVAFACSLPGFNPICGAAAELRSLETHAADRRAPG